MVILALWMLPFNAEKKEEDFIGVGAQLDFEKHS